MKSRPRQALAIETICWLIVAAGYGRAQDALCTDGYASLDSKFSTIAADGDTLRLGYIRALVGPCSVLTDGADCWSKIAAAAGLSGDAPDCAAGYRDASQKFAEDVCNNQRGDKKACLAEQMSRRADWDKAPSVIAFAANAVLDPSGSTISPAGGPVQCWPSD